MYAFMSYVAWASFCLFYKDHHILSLTFDLYILQVTGANCECVLQQYSSRSM